MYSHELHYLDNIYIYCGFQDCPIRYNLTMAKAKAKAKNRRPLRTPRGPAAASTNIDREAAPRNITRRAATIIHPSPTSVPHGVARAHLKHKDDLIPKAQEHPTLADRFHALPPELRDRIFALLFLQPVKWNLQHNPTRPLSNPQSSRCSSIRPRIPFREYDCWVNRSGRGCWYRNNKPTAWLNPWRSKYAPPVRNEFLCSDCWDRRHRPRPFPKTHDLVCLCARRRELDVLLVCRRWYEEGGWVFYSRNVFGFEDGYVCLLFLESLAPRWRAFVTGVSLMAITYDITGEGSSPRFTISERKRQIQIWSLLRSLPRLRYLELHEYYLTNLASTLLPLLRQGPKTLKSVRIISTSRPESKIITATNVATPSSNRTRRTFTAEGIADTQPRFIWQSLSQRRLIRGGLVEVLARALKGQTLPWGGLLKAAQARWLHRSAEWLRAQIREKSAAEVGDYVVDVHDEKVWEQLWWLVGLQHAFLPGR